MKFPPRCGNIHGRRTILKVKVYIHSLGCAKNLVNSEQMAALITQAGMEIVKQAELCDVAVVNTCGFIDAAKAEAIDAILSIAPLKQQGGLKALIMAGCLSERYRDQVFEQLPEVDAVLGTGSYTDIVPAIKGALSGAKYARYEASSNAELGGNRLLMTPKYSAYLRVAEGCDNRCSYCVIPDLRGPFRSRTIESLVEESKTLAQNGVTELILIAQDTTRYGTDIYGERALLKLVKQLEQIEGIRWIRLHYLYPDELDESLLEHIAQSEKILHYFDLPLQHISDKILSDMNRRGDSELIKKRLDTVRRLMPDSIIRTSLIVGFPGETEEDFDLLYDFLAQYKLERVGVFTYSAEEGTPAAEMENQVPEHIKEQRRESIYRLQQDIMEAHSEQTVGKLLWVLCCGQDEQGRQYGRSFMDSPDIDGAVYFEDETVKEGQYAQVRITYADGPDLYGKVEKQGEKA